MNVRNVLLGAVDFAITVLILLVFGIAFAPALAIGIFCGVITAVLLQVAGRMEVVPKRQKLVKILLLISGVLTILVGAGMGLTGEGSKVIPIILVAGGLVVAAGALALPGLHTQSEKL